MWELLSRSSLLLLLLSDLVAQASELASDSCSAFLSTQVLLLALLSLALLSTKLSSIKLDIIGYLPALVDSASAATVAPPAAGAAKRTLPFFLAPPLLRYLRSSPAAQQRADSAAR